MLSKLAGYLAPVLLVAFLVLGGFPQAQPRAVGAASIGLQNPGFESGRFQPWTSSIVPGGAAVVVEGEGPAQFSTYTNMGGTTVKPYKGSYMLRLGVPKGPSESQSPGENLASQTFTSDSSGTIKFSFRLFSWEFRGLDTFRFNLSGPGGTVGHIDPVTIPMPDGSAISLTDSNRVPAGGWGFTINGKYKNGLWEDSTWKEVTITGVPANTSLTLTYACGGTGSGSHPTWAYFDNVNVPPIAKFTFQPFNTNPVVNPREGGRVQLQDLSTDPDDDIVAWLWTINGPGMTTRTCTAQNPLFIPPDDGTYSVKLKVTDSYGASDIVVSGGTATDGTPVPAMTVLNTSPQIKALNIETRVGQDVNLFGRFVDHGWLDTHTAEWNITGLAVQPAAELVETNKALVDAGTVTGVIPGTTFGSAQTLNGTLTIKDNGGLSTSSDFTINVLEPNTADSEPNYTLNQAPFLDSGSVYSSYIQSAGDVDVFEIKGAEGEDLQAGSEALVGLQGLPADYDLALVAVPPAIGGSAQAISMDIFPMDIFSMDIFPMDIFSMDIFPMDIFSMDIFSMDIFPMDIFPMDIFPMDIFPMDIFASQTLSGENIRGTDILPSDIGLPDFGPGARVVGFSAGRGLSGESAIARISITGTHLFAVVLGANGAFSSNPYSLQVETSIPPTSVLDSYQGSPLVTSPAGQTVLFAPDNSPATLFVTQRERLKETYNMTEIGWTNFLSKLQSLASQPTVHGDILSVSSSIYDQWDISPGSIDQADSVSEGIRTAVQSYLTAHPSIKYVVIVGSDNIVPFRRAPDSTTFSNERLYALSSFLKPGSPIFSSLLQGYNLTDDYYVDKSPAPFQGRELYAPDLPIGRLVETPQDIAAAADLFISKGGILKPGDAFVSGYDFFADGASAMAANLSSGGLSVNSLVSNNWTAANLSADFLGGASPGINAVNAHFSHYAALSASGFSNQTQDVLTAYNVSTAGSPGSPALPGRIVFSVGCHAGLNVPDENSLAAIQGTGINPSLDFPQAMAEQRAIYVASTGFGLGETEGLGGTELLMTELAKSLVQNQAVGDALVQAKKDYLGSLSTITEYDEKSSIQATLYGLPMYRIQVPSPLATAAAISGETAGSLIVKDGSQVATVDYSLVEHSAADGFYYTANGDSQATPGRPIQPRLVEGITQVAGNPVHGALVTGGTFADITGFNPAIARPTIDWQNPDVPANFSESQDMPALYWPGQPAGINSLDPAQQNLVVIPAQFKQTGIDQNGHATGTERLYTNLSIALQRSSVDDWQPPAISSVDLRQLNGTTTEVSLDARDESGISRVVILRINGNSLVPISVGESGEGNFKIEIPAISSLDRLFLQVVDGAGNVATYSAKGANLNLIRVEAGPDRGYDPGESITFAAGIADFGVNPAVLVPPVFYGWDFGDLQAASGIVTSGALSVAHTYGGSRVSGDGTVSQAAARLKVTDSFGGVGVDIARVTARTEPSLSVTSSISPISILGQSVTFTATVNANGNYDWPIWTPVPAGGTVTFSDNGSAFATVAVITGVKSATASVTTQSLTVGVHSITATYSGDEFFLPGGTPGTTNQAVHYNWGGFQSPIDGSQYTVGRTVPVKFTLTDYGGKNVDGVEAVVSARLGTSPNTGTPTVYGTATSKTSQYQFSLDTTIIVGAAPDLWLTIAVEPGDGSTHEISVQLK